MRIDHAGKNKKTAGINDLPRWREQPLFADGDDNAVLNRHCSRVASFGGNQCATTNDKIDAVCTHGTDLLED